MFWEAHCAKEHQSIRFELTHVPTSPSVCVQLLSVVRRRACILHKQNDGLSLFDEVLRGRVVARSRGQASGGCLQHVFGQRRSLASPRYRCPRRTLAREHLDVCRHPRARSWCPLPSPSLTAWTAAKQQVAAQAPYTLSRRLAFPPSP